VALIVIILLIKLFKKESSVIGVNNLPDGSPATIQSDNPFM